MLIYIAVPVCSAADLLKEEVAAIGTGHRNLQDGNGDSKWAKSKNRKERIN